MALALVMGMVFTAALARAANPDTVNTPDQPAVYEQMAENPMLYQVTAPHVIGGQAEPVGSKCDMPPGTIYYDKPHDLFIYCDGKTWKRFSGSSDK